MGEKKNMEELGMTPKGLANEWATRPLTKLGNTKQKTRAGRKKGGSNSL